MQSLAAAISSRSVQKSGVDAVQCLYADTIHRNHRSQCTQHQPSATSVVAADRDQTFRLPQLGWRPQQRQSPHRRRAAMMMLLRRPSNRPSSMADVNGTVASAGFSCVATLLVVVLQQQCLLLRIAERCDRDRCRGWHSLW